jgi:hypothetical protein
MLEGVDEIDWSSLDHAYGAAEDVPALLRDLVSGDSAVRKNASYELAGNIYHQGTVYSATCVALPFLIELLATPGVPDKSDIATHILKIAEGHGGPSYLDHHGMSLEADRSRGPEIVERIRALVSPILKELSSYLHNDEPFVRESFARALPCYPEHIEWSIPALEKALSIETDEAARHYMEESLAKMRKIKSGGLESPSAGR